MALYLVTRPKTAPHLKNPAALHGAIVDAVDGPAAIAAANTLATQQNALFEGYDATQIAVSAQAGFVPALIQGDVLGEAYSGLGRGA